MRVELILAGSLVAPAIVAFIASRSAGRLAFSAAALLVAVGAAAGRVGFDSIVQRDAPDVVRGRSFARFETRFQLIWVVGALIGLVPVSGRLGLLGLSAVLGFAGVSYVMGIRAARESVERRRRRAERSRAIVRSRARDLLARLRRRRARREPPPAPPPLDPREPVPASTEPDEP